MNYPSERPALLIIDVQQGLDQLAYWGGNRNNPGAEANIGRLLDRWRALGLPVFHVRHDSVNPNSPLYPGKPGNEIKEVVKPMANESVITKSVNSAFIGTDLEQQLRSAGIRQLVMTGLVTDHCVTTTARMAGNLGFEVFVVEDGTATFDRTGPDGETHPAARVHAIHLASLHGEFARIVRTEEVLTPLNEPLFAPRARE
ncbi:MAG: cysteine hydrolase [Ferruginibacter sp.]|nr:cysteine hydrolase [Cytophagales bacterium]